MSDYSPFRDSKRQLAGAAIVILVLPTFLLTVLAALDALLTGGTARERLVFSGVALVAGLLLWVAWARLLRTPEAPATTDTTTHLGNTDEGDRG